MNEHRIADKFYRAAGWCVIVAEDNEYHLMKRDKQGRVTRMEMGDDYSDVLEGLWLDKPVQVWDAENNQWVDFY